MFLSKNPKGVYYVFYNQPNGKRTCLSTGSNKKSEAIKFLSQFKQHQKEISERKFIPISLKEFRWEYLKYSESFHTWKTTLTYKTTFNSMMKYFGEIQLVDLNRKNIEEYIQSLVRKTSIYSGRKDLINLKASLNWAVLNNYLIENPARLIKRLKVPERLPLYYTREDFQKLVNVIDDKDIRDLVIFAVNTGLRQEELINLQFRQVNFSDKSLILDNQTHITKSKKIRTLPLNDKAFSVITERNKDNKDLVFTLNGRLIQKDYLIHKFKKYVLKAEINSKLNFHSLRHTFASWLVQGGVSIYHVSKLLGHADIKTTEIYAHLSLTDLKISLDIL